MFFQTKTELPTENLNPRALALERCLQELVQTLHPTIASNPILRAVLGPVRHLNDQQLDEVRRILTRLLDEI